MDASPDNGGAGDAADAADAADPADAADAADAADPADADADEPDENADATAPRESLQSILVNNMRNYEEKNALRQSSMSSMSAVDGERGGREPHRRFALRLSQDSAARGSRQSGRSLQSGRSERSHQSGSQHSASRSWHTDVTDQSSPDSFVQGQSNQHFQAAAVQAKLQLRRRAGSDEWTEEVSNPAIRCVQRIATSKIFLGIITLLIFLHVVLMGVEADIYASSPSQELQDWFDIINLVLVCCFVVELALKFIAFGCRDFWCGSDWAWNAFDFLVVALSVLDVTFQYSLRASVTAGQVRVFRILRAFRYFRSIRVVRLFRYISALQVLTLSIVGTMSSFLWQHCYALLCIGIAFASFPNLLIFSLSFP